jgi:hypothetical protein
LFVRHLVGTDESNHTGYQTHNGGQEHDRSLCFAFARSRGSLRSGNLRHDGIDTQLINHR